MKTLFISEAVGSDDSGEGSESKPFKTLLKAMLFAGKPFPNFMVATKDETPVSIDSDLFEILLVRPIF
jgi:asparaginyl-tRNA synthetase